MRVAIPDRLQTKHVAIFIAVLFMGQGIEGTNVIFMVLTSVYVALWATAFNTAGGLAYPSGAFIFSNGLFSVVVGLAAKVILVEPGERNLLSPILTMVCYCTGMTMLLLVAVVVRALRPREALIKNFDSLEALRRGSVICFAIGVGLAVLTSGGAGSSTGSALSALRQINDFPTMSILLATTYAVKSTNGRRSTNWVVLAGIGMGIFYAVFFFGKGSLLSPLLAWVVAASLQGYNFKRNQVIGLAISSFFILYYFVPYSQYVRDFGSRTGSLRENIPVALEYLSDLNRTRRLYYEAMEDYDIGGGGHLYDQREGFLDRLIIFGADDALIDYTEKGHVFGLLPTVAEFENVVPHFIWKDKPIVNAGNMYGHELDWLPEDDFTTGIAFSATADAFHQAKWLGILVVMPPVIFLVFIVFDTIAGNARVLPFALLPVINFFNMGSAGGLDSSIHVATFGAVSYLVIVWTAKTAAPWVLRIFKGKSFAPLTDAAASGIQVAPPALAGPGVRSGNT